MSLSSALAPATTPWIAMWLAKMFVNSLLHYVGLSSALLSRFAGAKIIHLLISSIINAIFLKFIKHKDVFLTLISSYTNKD